MRDAMQQSEFRVVRSSNGYRVEMRRDGQPCVTLLDGLTKQGAEREARELTALWLKVSAPPDIFSALSAKKAS